MFNNNQGFGAQAGFNNLPFSTTQLMHQIYQIDINNPPIVHNINIHPELATYLRPITGIAVMTIQNSAQKNPLRTYSFNQLAVNGFNNQDFATFMLTMVDLMTYSIFVLRTFSDPQTAAQAAAEKMLEYWCAVQVANQQGLQAMLDPQTMHTIQGLIKEFQTVSQGIQQMKQGGMGGGFSSQGFQGSNQGGFNQRSAPIGSQPQQQQVGMGNPTGLFVTSGGNIQQGKSNSQVVDRYASRNTSVNKDNPIEQPFTSRAPIQQEQAVIPVVETNLVWTASDEQPHFPAYAPSKTNLSLVRSARGNTLAILAAKQGAQLFEYDQHATPHVLGVPHRLAPVKDTTRRTTELLDALKLPVQVVKKDDTEVVLENVSVIELEETLFETSKEVAFLNHNLKMTSLRRNSKAAFKAYRSKYMIAQGLGEFDELTHAELKSMQNLKTYRELAKRMNMLATKTNTQVWNSLNRELTEVINRQLSLHLSLKLSIDSFASSFNEDDDDLLKYLEKRGTIVYEKFLSKQAETISKFFVPIDIDLKKSIYQEFLSDEDAASPNDLYEFLIRELTVTSIELDGPELDSEIHESVGSCLTHEQTPVLYSVARQYFNDNPGHSGSLSQHFLITSDGQVLELARGFINPDFYVVRLVKSIL